MSRPRASHHGAAPLKNQEPTNTGRFVRQSLARIFMGAGQPVAIVSPISAVAATLANTSTGPVPLTARHSSQHLLAFISTSPPQKPSLDVGKHTG
jgi:hypothetical protein